MCDKCTDIENTPITDEELAELQAQLGQINNDGEILIDPLLIGTDNLEDIEYDEEEFNRGIKEYSYIAGAITALRNAGLGNVDVMNYILNKETIEHNLKLSGINNKAQIEISKNQSLLIEKNQL